jgi:hypothetical protein
MVDVVVVDPGVVLLPIRRLVRSGAIAAAVSLLARNPIPPITVSIAIIVAPVGLCF